jgi:hypothetical protein
MKNTQLKLCLCAAASALALLWAAPSARANVYATNIKLNGSLTGATNTQGAPVTISYILNEPATLGTTIQILSGATVVNTISIPAGTAGSLRGTNIVSWSAQVPAGTYSVAITPAATGYTTWTQTSVDPPTASPWSSSGLYCNYPLGMDVDKNTNSPYYGRVIVGCASAGANANTPPAAKAVGLFKNNADGSQADEGWYGNAGYLADDAGDPKVAGQMPTSYGYNPEKIRIGADDRIYWCDNGDLGAIIATDMQATTNQVVITEGSGYGSQLSCTSTYANNPAVIAGTLVYGIKAFDIAFNLAGPNGGQTNAAIFLTDSDYPNWGVWTFQLTNAVPGAGLVADPNDTEGTQVVQTGGDLSLVSSGGCMVDNNLDIFVGQMRGGDGDPCYIAMMFANWNSGVLPPEATAPGGSPLGFFTGAVAGEVEWGYGSGVDVVQSSSDPTFEDLQDMVIDSRVNPKFLACPLGTGNNGWHGIRVLNAVTNYGKFFYGTVGDQAGAIVTVTNGNGQVIQSLANLDGNNTNLGQLYGQAYNCAAWDNVGNLYGASPTRNIWRVWSPPGPNTNTTVAVGQVTLIQRPTITNITVVGTTVTITFTGPASALASAFTLYSSGAVTGPYAAVVPPATITALSPAGNFQAVTTASGSTRFYKVYGP